MIYSLLSNSMTIQNDGQQSSQIWAIRIGGGWKGKLFGKRDEIDLFLRKPINLLFLVGMIKISIARAPEWHSG